MTVFVILPARLGEIGAAIAVLAAADFNRGETLPLALAAGTGIVCAILHYHIDRLSRFWNRFIPLIADAGVVAVFLAVMALSRDCIT
jgi:hypothetical protein